jgi:HK97 family phage prohead protease/HK97 family phage major capsid protein
MQDSLETREMEIRFDPTTREVVGMAVPYDQVSNGEMFTRGAVTLDAEAKLFWQHKEPIGKIVAGEQTDAGFMVRASISETALGQDVHTLLKDGVINKMSVGFVMRDAQVVDGVRQVTDALVREVSLVPFPWYDGASVTSVRDEPESEVPTSDEKQGEIVDPEETTPDASELAEVREAVEVMQRELVVLKSSESAPVVDHRSAGEFIAALAKGDEMAVRAYTGANTGDSVVTPIDRDLTRIVENAAPLRQVFSTGTTPMTGMSIYFAQLKGITDGTAAQAAEGDDLGYYEVQLETKNVALKTLGSYSQLSIQSIMRSTVDFLNTTFRGQAIALGNKLNAELIAQYKTTVAAQITANNKVSIAATGATYNTWLAAITDAAVKFSALGLAIEYLIVDTTTFKELVALQGGDGRPVLLVDGNGVNNVGTISPTGLGGSFAGIRVVAVAELNTNKSQCAFVNSAALRQYTSASLRLETDNAINLSNSYSLSVVSAVADEYPTAIVGIVRA